MRSIGKFDTDAAALIQRIQAHEKYSTHDLNQWVFHHLKLSAGLSILELGCGTGKQTVPLAQKIGIDGHILALDISSEALEELSKQSNELGLEKRITLRCLGFDDLKGELSPGVFDRALACYSLYYAKQTRVVMKEVYNSLRPGGILFFCGPGKDNNLEIKKFHSMLLGEPLPPESGASIFMEETGQQLARELFATVEIHTFENPLRFDSPEGLYAYWSSYNLYDEKLDGNFKTAAQKYFQEQSIFETTKRVIGVHAIK
jgi:ubiquinone/menaquinone biosynthesis C-methylase UbiE